MDFEYDCWRCWETNAVYGEPRGFLNVWYQLPAEWTCYCCGAINITPDD
ncbi:hypothetical protein [Streptomyces sp. NRRL B-24484]|nr:hypothetical protein [Streptomyces sp. NRRL B-24484]